MNQLTTEKAEKAEKVKPPPAQPTKPLKNNAAQNVGSGGQQQNTTNAGKPKKCYGCQQEGHVIADCPVVKKAQELLKKGK